MSNWFQKEMIHKVAWKVACHFGVDRHVSVTLLRLQVWFKDIQLCKLSCGIWILLCICNSKVANSKLIKRSIGMTFYVLLRMRACVREGKPVTFWHPCIPAESCHYVVREQQMVCLCWNSEKQPTKKKKDSNRTFHFHGLFFLVPFLHHWHI